MLLEHFLHLKEHIEGSYKISLLRMQSPSDSLDAPHDHSHKLPLLDREISSDVIGHGIAEELEERDEARCEAL